MTLPCTKQLVAVALALPLAACASGDTSRYPSLAIRDVERISGTAEPVQVTPTPEVPVPASPDLSQRLTQLVERAREAHRTFLDKLEPTRRTVGAGSGAAVASENWAVAQAALSGLDAARNPAIVALADLDSLYVQAELDAGAADAVAAARDQVQALVSEEEVAIDELAGRIGG